jgi:hypothetical protein
MIEHSVAAAPTFDRTAHCQRAGASGGNTTVARHGTAHMSRIGRVGAAATIQKHGVSYFNGLMVRRGWSGRRPVSLRADLAAGRLDADLAA